MSARYTSAALSRRLRDAGLGQRLAEAVWYPSPTRGDLWVLVLGENGGVGQVRALRLDEVLEEIERYCAPSVFKLPNGRWEAIGGTRHVEDTHVEAAGLVLAQILEARRG